MTGGTANGRPRSERVSTRQRILVVDDVAEIREIVERFLSERGYLVETAADGAEALESIRREPPDIVLLDMEMPGLSGLDVLRRIKVEAIDVLVIGISGHGVANEHLAPHSRRLGAADFIFKPFNLDDLETSRVAMLQTSNAQ